MSDEVEGGRIGKGLIDPCHRRDSQVVRGLVFGEASPEVHHASVVDELQQCFVDGEIGEVKVGMQNEKRLQEKRSVGE